MRSALHPTVLCSTPDLADLRLVDGLPDLLETGDEPPDLELAVPEGRRDDTGRSRFRLELPYAELPGGRLVLTTGARVFERPVRLLRSASSRRGEALLAATVWRHDDPRAAAPALELDLPPRAGRELDLEIDDADNAPLPLSGARLELPARQLRFHAPEETAGSGLTLLYGRPRLPPPRYDLALLAGPARELPAQAVYLPAPPRAAEEGWLASRGWIWAILGGTIVGLLVLLARLLGSTSRCRPE